MPTCSTDSRRRSFLPVMLYRIIHLNLEINFAFFSIIGKEIIAPLFPANMVISTGNARASTQFLDAQELKDFTH